MKKAKIYLTDTEWRVLYLCLNEYKTKLHDEGRHTDTVDDTLLKVITAPVKKVKVAVYFFETFSRKNLPASLDCAGVI